MWGARRKGQNEKDLTDLKKTGIYKKRILKMAIKNLCAWNAILNKFSTFTFQLFPCFFFLYRFIFSSNGLGSGYYEKAQK